MFSISHMYVQQYLKTHIKAKLNNFTCCLLVYTYNRSMRSLFSLQWFSFAIITICNSQLLAYKAKTAMQLGILCMPKMSTSTIYISCMVTVLHCATEFSSHQIRLIGLCRQTTYNWHWLVFDQASLNVSKCCGIYHYSLFKCLSTSGLVVRPLILSIGNSA